MSTAWLCALALLSVACAAAVDTGAREEYDPPPTEQTALDRWFWTGEHERWESWSQVGPTLGSGGARVFLSPPLVESLSNGNARHPVGAAAVRELYAEDFATLTGYSILVKQAEPSLAESWFCFERLELDTDEVEVARVGEPGCGGCHVQGVDFIRSTLPLP